MKKNLFVFAVMLVFACIALSGCAASPKITKLTRVWKYDMYTGGYPDQVMVVGKTKKAASRAALEDHMAGLLSKYKITAIPSYTVIPNINLLERERVKQAAIDKGVNAVLATKVVSVDEEEVIFNSQSYERVHTPMGMYMRPTMPSAPQVERITKVRVETGLFELKTEELIWAATSSVMDPDTVDEAIKDYSAAIIQQLVNDGYLKK
jgi:hypothetical protein